jgi:hypothetical protein
MGNFMRAYIFIALLSLLVSKVSLGQSDSNYTFSLSKGSWKFPTENIKRIVKYEDYKYKEGCYFGKSMTIYSAESSQVKSVHEGRVILTTFYDDVYMVVISYGKYFLWYANILNLKAKKGDWVATGQVIGEFAKNLDDEFSCQLILSYEEEELDPELWFNKSCP